MRRAILFILTVSLLTVANLSARSAQGTSDTVMLTKVRIVAQVMAGGNPLPPGVYELRLTNEHPVPLAGQPPNAQQWVEFVADGKVIAREAAEVLHDDDLPPVGASSEPVRVGTRVEMLKGGEFLRISVKREGVRYLIHLPVMAGSTSS